MAGAGGGTGSIVSGAGEAGNVMLIGAFDAAAAGSAGILGFGINLDNPKPNAADVAPPINASPTDANVMINVPALKHNQSGHDRDVQVDQYASQNHHSRTQRPWLLQQLHYH